MKKLLLGLLFPTALAFPAGPISIGVKGGVPLNDAFNTVTTGRISYLTNTKRYTIGPELDINLPLGLAVEVDALYRRLNFESTGNEVDVFVRRATTANAWDIPLLLKWRFGKGGIKPYLAAGPTFRGVTNIKQITNFFSEPSGSRTQASTSNPAELANQFTTGFTVGGGLQFGGGGIHLSPEVRYTRWGWNTFRDPASAFRSNPDQVDVLVGLTF